MAPSVLAPVTRGRALALVAAAPLAGCAGSAHSGLAIGSKNFTEELILGELYAQLLEKHGLSVTRKLNLGGTQVAMEALQRGDIDLYPEYTGTALITILKQAPIADGAEAYDTVKRAYAERFNLVWLTPAPANNTQALATTQAVSQRYQVRTLSELSRAAPQLRLGAIPEFTKREDGLPGLQRAYGGFQFKDVKLFDIGLKYEALHSGNVDVVVAFGTDGQIAADKLLVFVDDKRFWPAYHVAPVVRKATLAKFPEIAPALDGVQPLLSDEVMRNLNEQVDGETKEPADVARAFLKAHGLV
ncbi:MAG TPA: glycine betaine ABC transporter substrate-binding protein [Candidatus Baltobacteraceae bacterium]|nr:glycine betaine ABC transporter substrate-binding protein [Candidatus Baltobacteraceae bacterium]